MNKSDKDSLSILLLIVGELFLMLAAAYVGYILGGGGKPTQVLDRWLFYGLLVFGVIFKFIAGKLK